MCGIQYSHRVRKENSKNAATAGHQSRRIFELVRKGIKLLISFYLCVPPVLYKQGRTS
jgi:hypothetical protein